MVQNLRDENEILKQERTEWEKQEQFGIKVIQHLRRQLQYYQEKYPTDRPPFVNDNDSDAMIKQFEAKYINNNNHNNNDYNSNNTNDNRNKEYLNTFTSNSHPDSQVCTICINKNNNIYKRMTKISAHSHFFFFFFFFFYFPIFIFICNLHIRLNLYQLYK